MSLTDHDIDTFIKTGAAVVDGIIPKVIIDAASDEMDAMYAADTENPTGIRQYLAGPAFEALYQCPGLEDAAKRILGADNVHLLASATLHTLPNAETWSYNPESEHVDIQYTMKDWMETPREIIVTFMIFLDDVTPERAPTVARLGSHLQVAEYNGDEAFQEKPVFFKDLPDLGYEDITPLCGNKGQVAISTTALVHTGSANATDKARKVMFVTFSASHVSPAFNINKSQERLDWLEDVMSRMPAERQHIIQSSIDSVKKIIEENLEKVTGGSLY